MGRCALEVVLLNVACAFLSCHADVGDYEMELKSTPQSTSFLQRTTSAQSVSPYQITSSSHAVTTLFSSRTSNIITTPLSQRTSVLTAAQTTNHHPVTTASAHNMTTQARENSTKLTSKMTHLILTTTVAGKKTTAKPPLPTNETTTHVRVQTSNKTTIQRTEKTTLPTNQTTHSRMAAAAKKTTAKPTSLTNQTTTLAVTTTATTKKTAVKTTTQPTKQTTHTAAKTTARTNMTTIHSFHSNETTTHVRVTTTAQTSNKTTIQRTEKTTLPANHTTHSRRATTSAAKKTTAKPTSPTNQTTTLAVTTIATTKKTTVKTTTQPSKQTTHTAARTTARTNMTTILPRNETTRPATTATVGPTLAPDPSSPITGAYNVSNGSVNCIKASMGLELIVQNSKMQKKGYFNIDPSITQPSGRCGNLQSNLNLTFNGGFISFTFVKKDRVYYISTIEASLKIPSVGSWHNVTSKQLFTATMGNSFKCLSKQMVNLADNFQLLTANTQLQAFDIVGNQFGKVEECAADFNIIFPAMGFFVIFIAGILALILYVVCHKRKLSAYQRI
ncbi:lysosome-associated membrane glycoprotein 3 isoform 2-T2 [Macrochelys suwanniensis]